MKRILILLLFFIVIFLSCKKVPDGYLRIIENKEKKPHTKILKYERIYYDDSVDAFVEIICIDGYKYLMRYNMSIVQMREFDGNGNITLSKCEDELE